MRILQISHAFPPTFGGVESHLWDITHGLARRGHQVACLVGGRRETAKLELAGPTHIAVDRTPELSVSHLLEKRRGLDVRAFAASLYREHRAIVSAAMRKFQPDILHIHNSHHFAPELAAATLECAGGVPVLNGVHDRVGEHIFDEVLSYPWACVVYASRYLADALPSSRPSKVLHLGIDLTLFRADGPRDVRMAGLQRPIIFHPARLLRWKGVMVGVEAFVAVRKGLGRGSLVLCDSAQTVDDQAELRSFRNEIQAAAIRAGLADHVHFLRFAREDMPEAYRACDLVWYPTIEDEPLGLAPLEAMACGAPLVVSRSGGMTETVLHGRTGLIVAKSDTKALASAALDLLKDDADNAALRARLVEQAKRHSRRFSGESYVDALELLYEAQHAGGTGGESRQPRRRREQRHG